MITIPRWLIAIFVIVGLFGLVGYFGCSVVEMEEVHVAQNYLTGNVFAQTKQGPYLTAVHQVREFKTSDTFYFTKDKEGGAGDYSIEVRYNDGAKGWISGTCRVDLPKDETQLVNLVKKNFTNWTQIEEKLILPVVRKAALLSANSMSSKESYCEKQSDFYALCWDQIQHGPYKMVTKDTKVADPITGVMVTKIIKEIMKDKDGNPIRDINILEGTGVILSNFEIKKFDYAPEVEAQISEQQKNMMAVQTAKATAQKAEQQALTAEAEGKAKVMTAKYEQEVIKATEVTAAEKKVAIAEQSKKEAEVLAEQEKKVAEIAAQKLVAVATLTKEEALVKAGQLKEVAVVNLEAAKTDAAAVIATATAKAESNRMILASDGALSMKLEAYVKGQQFWAESQAKRPVPQIVMVNGGSAQAAGVPTGSATDSQQIMEMLQIKLAKDLMLDPVVRPPVK